MEPSSKRPKRNLPQVEMKQVFRSLKGGQNGNPCLTKAEFKQRILIDREQLSLAFATTSTRQRELVPVILEFDVDFEEEVERSDSLYQYWEATHLLVATMQEQQAGDFVITLVCRPGRWKKRNGKTVWHTGFHVYTSHKAYGDWTKALRVALLKKSEAILEIFEGTVSSVEEILDDALYSRRNGLQVVGQEKRAKGRPIAMSPEIFYAGDSSLPSLDFIEREEKDPDLEMSLYDWIWEDRAIRPETVKDEVEVMTDEFGKASIEAVVERFSLEEFLKVSICPNHSDYKSLTSYFAYLGLDPKLTCQLCNRAWKKATWETKKIMEFYQKDGARDKCCRKRKVLDILRGMRVKFEEDKIWPTDYKYSDYKLFMGKHTTMEAVDHFLSNVCINARHNGGTSYVYTEYSNSYDMHKNIIKVPSIRMEKEAPFCGEDCFGFYVKKQDKKGEWVDKIVWSKDRMTHLKRMGFVKRMKTVFKPPGAPFYQTPEIKNLWPGYPIDHYTPKKKINVKDTILWQFFKDVFPQDRWWVFTYFALIINCPGRRTGRILVLASKTQGCGKSTIWEFLRCRWGPV